MKSLWMLVTADEYELPLIIADTRKELSDKCGASEISISSCISKVRHGVRKRSIFVKVDLDEE